MAISLDLNTSDIIPGSDDEEEVLTPSQIHERLLQAWENEKVSPDLLEARPELVEYVQECARKLRHQAQSAKHEDVRYTALLMQATRLEYLLTDYTRCRLKKVEMFYDHLIHEESQRPDNQLPKMTANEFRFAKAFSQSFKSFYDKMLLSKVPSNMKKLDTQKIAMRPNAKAYVFVRVLEDRDHVASKENPSDPVNDYVDFRQGELHLIQYAFVRDLVQAGVVSLM